MDAWYDLLVRSRRFLFLIRCSAIERLWPEYCNSKKFGMSNVHRATKLILVNVGRRSRLAETAKAYSDTV